IFCIINLETAIPLSNVSVLHSLFADGITADVVEMMPAGNFKEVMYHNGVIDPKQQAIIELCAKRGVAVEAVKVGYRYYGKSMNDLYVNKVVHIAFTAEPQLTTLKPSGVRQEMQYFDLCVMEDTTLTQLSQDRELHLSLSQMKQLVHFQKQLGLLAVSDVYLETFAAFWSEHCFHTLWKALGLFKMLKAATARIGNPNLLSAFVDNAGVWDFYDGLALLFKLETHNSPTQSEPFGGQMTKLGGVIRDILENGLGAKSIGNLELTVIGELVRKRYSELQGAMSASVMARETVRAIASYGNPMGIPMLLARMMSHPDFSGKPFALGGTVGITTRAAAEKGVPHEGDLVVLVGGRTGNDGLHGATISSGGITEHTDSGDKTHVQIGLPFTEQKMVRAGVALRDAGCCSARNDFGAAGIVSCFGEMGKGTDGVGGILVNLALVPLKCAGMANWQIALSESQERFGHAVKPEKWAEARAIYEQYGLEATVIGVFTKSQRFQMFYDAGVISVPGMELSGEICLDVPYAFFDECPLPEVVVQEPVRAMKSLLCPKYPKITPANVREMGLHVVGHFDVCDQSSAITQYDASVQGITFQGPLYGKDYNVATSLAVLRPVFGKPFGATVSISFSPWHFEADPVSAAVNTMMDVLVTQVVAGVQVQDIALSDNFYTDGADPVSLWYLREQVKALTGLSLITGTPFITGKDSSSGRGTFGGVTVKVPPSVAITALGKVPDVHRLVPHQWQGAGNKLVVLGPRAVLLDGSILSSSLGIAGTTLDRFPVAEARTYLEELDASARQGVFASAVPINRGGVFLRLFEGIEASGLGFEAEVCAELFPESMGCVLVEVSPEDAEWLLQESDFDTLVVGTIVSDRKLSVQGVEFDLNSLRQVWQGTFKEALYGNE
ncbi:MAG: AIR synthase-related protein, partial [Candidatus Moraniibacteriota bacterium]